MPYAFLSLKRRKKLDLRKDFSAFAAARLTNRTRGDILVVNLIEFSFFTIIANRDLRAAVIAKLFLRAAFFIENFVSEAY